MERGEVEATAQPWPVIRRENAEWLRDKKINLLVQTGDHNQGLEHLPRMTDLAKTEENRKVLEIFAAPAFIGRSIFTIAQRGCRSCRDVAQRVRLDAQGR